MFAEKVMSLLLLSTLVSEEELVFLADFWGSEGGGAGHIRTL